MHPPKLIKHNYDRLPALCSSKIVTCEKMFACLSRPVLFKAGGKMYKWKKKKKRF